jgi:diacylglycerol kinase (ATP)
VRQGVRLGPSWALTSMSVAVIINPVAGGTRPDAARARAELAAATIERHGETADILVTERAGHARLLATAAVQRGARVVMAWGGDGTINEVASALAFGETAMAIVPSGSGNGLARALGIDRRPERAIANAIGAKPDAMDLGELGGRLFVNLAGIGLDASVASRFNTPNNRRRGFAGYLRLVTGVMLTYEPATYSISVADVRRNVRAVLVVIANSTQYGNGARIAPDARTDDGQLDLVVVEERSRFVTFCRTPRLFDGTVGRMPEYSIQRIREATIECTEPMVFHVDGEPVEGGTQLAARVHPGALRICVK